MSTVSSVPPIYPPKNIEIYAHRGITAYFPENTLLSYQESLKLGVNSLDIDVAMTRDNIIVGSHDPFLNKDLTRDSSGKWLDNNNIKIIDLTFTELQKYDVGRINPASPYSTHFPLQKGFDNIPIPSLDQLIDLIKLKGKDFHKLQIEIKTNPELDKIDYIEKFVKTIVSVLEKNNFLARAELQSFDWRALLYAKKIYPKIKISFITQQDSEFDTFSNKNNFAWTAGYNIKDFNNSIPQMIAKLGGDIWCPNYRNIVENLELINLAHSYNIKVVPWTVDTPEEMIALIDAGVDGIITNYAESLRGLLKVRNISLP